PIVAYLHEKPEGREDEQRPAGGVEDETGGPELLVEREPWVPDKAEDDAAGSGDGERQCFARVRPRGAQEEPGEHTHQRGAECRNGGDQSLRVTCVLVEMPCGEDLAVEPGDDIGVAIEERDVTAG